MAWLEITIDTASDQIDRVAAVLTARGFSDLVIEDQEELETFLDQNRAYWDYTDEELQQKLQGLSQIKLYLEDTDTASLARLEALAKEQGLSMLGLSIRKPRFPSSSQPIPSSVPLSWTK